VQPLQKIVEVESFPVITAPIGLGEIDENKPYELTNHRSLSAGLLFGILQILTIENIQRFIDRTKQLLIKEGLIFITAFSTQGPDFARHEKNWIRIAPNSFQTPDNPNDLRTYFEPNEIIELLDPDPRHNRWDHGRHRIIRLVSHGRHSSVLLTVRACHHFLDHFAGRCRHGRHLLALPWVIMYAPWIAAAFLFIAPIPDPSVPTMMRRLRRFPYTIIDG